MSDVFLSYKSNDRSRVRPVLGALRRAGLDVWWDRDIPPGEPWEASIQAALVRADLVVVFWTHGAVDPHEGKRVQDEAREALDAGKLVQVLLDQVAPPLFYRHYQAIDLTEWNGDTHSPDLAIVVDEVKYRLSGGQPKRREPLRSNDHQGYSTAAPSAVFVLNRTEWRGDAIPAPRSGEAWSSYGRVRVPRSFHVLGLKVARAEINKWCWSKASIKMIGHIDHGHTRVFSGSPSTEADASELFWRKRPKCIRTIDCALGDNEWIAMSDIRRISLVSFFYGCSVAELLPDGTVQSHRYADTSQLKFTDTESGHNSGDFYHDLGQVLRVSPNGKTIAFYHGKLESGAERGEGWTLGYWFTERTQHDPVKTEVEIDTSKYGKPTELVWAPSSDYLIASTGYSHLISEARTASIAPTSQNDNHLYRGVPCWHPSQLVFAQAYTEDADNGPWRIEIIDAKSLRCLFSRDFPHSKEVVYLGWSTDGRYIASASADRSVVVWDLKSDKFRTLYGSDGWPNYLEFSPDGTRLAVFGLGHVGEGSIWDPATGVELARFPARVDHRSSNVWHQDSRRLAYESDANTIEVIEISY